MIVSWTSLDTRVALGSVDRDMAANQAQQPVPTISIKFGSYHNVGYNYN
jgi:hypothetical protein